MASSIHWLLTSVNGVHKDIAVSHFSSCCNQEIGSLACWLVPRTECLELYGAKFPILFQSTFVLHH